MPNKNKIYTFGLDIGMASVGAALLTDDQILALHVRTFDKAETAKEGNPLNQTRRESRLTRRRIRRRAFRLLRLRRLFKRIGLVTSANTESFNLPDQQPWELRVAGLDRVLTPTEWAAVLYHIVKHRGFQSNRKSEEKADEKAGQMLSGVNRNKALLQEKGYRTVGELAARDNAFSQAKRNKGGDYSHTFSRADLEAELHLLFQCQREYGNEQASASIESQVHILLLARKPTLSGHDLLKMVGKCSFEPDEFRAPKASYRAERFVWLGKLNNLKISASGETRQLTEVERRQVVDLPFTQTKLTFKQLRKALGIPEYARFNLVAYRGGDIEKAEDITFFEAKAFHALRKAYKEEGLEAQWLRDAIDTDRLDNLAYAQTCFKDDKEARQYLEGLNVDAAIIEAVLELSFDKFINISQKALIKILPFMEQGQRYDQAALSAGYHHSQNEKCDEKTRFLPPPDKDTIRNPVVYRALNQARKLVNAIVREYGPPAAVHIELARDLSKPFDERRKIEKEQKTFQEHKTKARNDFFDRFRREPKALDLQKWLLYREQDSQCAYSQKPLDVSRLFEPGYAEVDHALPYSRSFDDSQNNKVLVLTVENRNKGNRTPYEYLGGVSNSNSESWQRFEAWVQGNKKIRVAKKNRLLRKNFGEEEANEFRDRNLNDTRYICREFKRMVETHLQWHEQAEGKERCVVVAGQLTALLRARWGLIKVRSDGDLHHALDAAVIAAANRKLVKRMSDYSRKGELSQVREQYVDPATGEVLDIEALRRQQHNHPDLEEKFPTPWSHFRQELLAYLSPEPLPALTMLLAKQELEGRIIMPVRVSRAPMRRGLGPAHQETIRSMGKEGRLIKEGLSSIKTSLSSLKLKDLENIEGVDDPRNASLIKAIRDRLEAHGGDGAKAFAANQPPLYKPSGEGKTAPVIRSVKLLSTQKSGLPVRHGFANNGSMLRVDIFTKGGKFYAVPLYVADAVKAELPNRAALQARPEEEWPVMDESYTFLFSLHPNDWLSVKLRDGVKEGYFSGLDRSTALVSLWTHDRNQSQGKDGLLRSIGIKTAMSLEKYHVDLLGRLHKVHHEVRQPLHQKKAGK
jgi:CRISPR-associated endonuclease Csn1